MPQARNPNVRENIEFHLTKDSRVAMLTFGGQQIYTMQKGSLFLANWVLTTGPAYTVFQGGLNFYVFETAAIPPEILDQPLMQPEGDYDDKLKASATT